MDDAIETTCPFCHPEKRSIFHEDAVVLGLWDAFPVSPGHALLVPKRHVPTWFDATAEEQAALLGAVARVKEEVERERKPDGWNIGINVGVAAGQTVFHLHVHVIPRYSGDAANPRGGVPAGSQSRRTGHRFQAGPARRPGILVRTDNMVADSLAAPGFPGALHLLRRTVRS